MSGCSSRKIFYFSSRYNCKFYCLLSIIIAFGIWYYYFYFQVTPLDNTRLCLKKAFQNINLQNFDAEWLKLNDTVDKCTNSLFEAIEVQKFPNNDETKLGILPKNLDSECNVITLGIGKDVSAEKQMSKALKKCKFLGIDPDFKESGYMYVADLRGLYVQGKIGTSTYENSVTKSPNYSFYDFIAQFYPHKTLEYLLMDIEGDEVPLMKELIDNPEKYPTICQINVEYHNPQDTKGYAFFKDMSQSLQNGPYIPVKVETLSDLKFNRIFFVNFKARYCIQKYLY